MDIKNRIKGTYYGWFFGPGAILRKGIDANYKAIQNHPEWSKIEKFEEIPSDYILYDQLTQTKIVHDILIKNQKISPELFKERFLELNEQDDILNNHQYGPSSQKAVRKLLDGVDPRQSGKTGVTTGAAMRCMPIGVYYRDDEQKLIKNTYESAIISHNTDVAINSAIAVNLMISELLTGKNKQEALNFCIDKLKNIEGSYGEPTAFASMSERIQYAIHTIENKNFKEATRLITKKIGFSWFAIEQIPAAFAIYFATNDAKEAALMSFKLGYGHTGPQIACAFHGVEKGHEIFPKEIMKKIEEVNKISIDQMVNEILK